MADEMRPAPSPSVDLWRPDGPAARAAAAIMANAVASFNEALVPALLAWAARSAWALAVVLTVLVRMACG